MIDLSKVCIKCGVLFVPSKSFYNVCKHCYIDPCNECDATEADIY